MFITTCTHTASFDSLRIACRHAAEAEQRRRRVAPVAHVQSMAGRLCALLASCLISGGLLDGIVIGLTSMVPAADIAMVRPSAPNGHLVARKPASSLLGLTA